MIKILVFINLYLLCHISLCAQDYNIVYNVNVNDPSPKWGRQDYYELHLYTNASNSLEYRKDIDTLIVRKDGVITETRNQFFSDTLKLQRKKDLDKKIIEFTTYNGQVHVKDSLDITYKKGDKKKEILGYSCQSLLFAFRGRYYEAYYTTDIPIIDGPFKFIGAPGMVLEVVSFDNSVVIKTKSIKKNTPNPIAHKSEPTFNFKNCEYVFSYNKYARVYVDHWNDIITKIESQYPNGTSSYTSRFIEVLPNKLDPEYHE